MMQWREENGVKRHGVKRDRSAKIGRLTCPSSFFVSLFFLRSPAKFGLRAATRCSVEGSALGRLGVLFRVHLKIIRLSGPPALK
jgi:hypothetical protein